MGCSSPSRARAARKSARSPSERTTSQMRAHAESGSDWRKPVVHCGQLLLEGDVKVAQHRPELERGARAQHRVACEQRVEAGAREVRLVHVEQQCGGEVAHPLPVGQAVGQRAVDEEELEQRCAHHPAALCKVAELGEGAREVALDEGRVPRLVMHVRRGTPHGRAAQQPVRGGGRLEGRARTEQQGPQAAAELRGDADLAHGTQLGWR
eukprot:scaffold22109_cov63-Phaeocystis_antarctica.AAC.8